MTDQSSYHNCSHSSLPATITKHIQRQTTTVTTLVQRNIKNFKSATVYYGGLTHLIFSALLLLYNSQAHDCMFVFQQTSPRQSELSGRVPQSDSQDRNSETKVTRMPYMCKWMIHILGKIYNFYCECAF